MERYLCWFNLATHVALPRDTTNSEHTSGAMDESSGTCSKMQAHIISGVVMDIAAFKVSHSVGVDIDATALQAKSGGHNVPLGRWMKVQGKVQGCKHT